MTKNSQSGAMTSAATARPVPFVAPFDLWMFTRLMMPKMIARTWVIHIGKIARINAAIAKPLVFAFCATGSCPCVPSSIRRLLWLSPRYTTLGPVSSSMVAEGFSSRRSVRQ
jgi:hypothetical protein